MTILLDYNIGHMFLVWCVLEILCGWVGVVSMLQAEALQHTSNQEHTTNVVIQQNSRKLLVMDILMSETCWAHKKWNKIKSDIKLVFHSSNFLVYCQVCCGHVQIKSLPCSNCMHLWVSCKLVFIFSKK